MRNKLSHHTIVTYPGHKFYLYSLGFYPNKMLRGKPFGQNSEEVDSLLVFKQALWLNLFSSDLTELVSDLRKPPPPEVLEIRNPQSLTAKEFREHQPA